MHMFTWYGLPPINLSSLGVGDPIQFPKVFTKGPDDHGS